MRALKALQAGAVAPFSRFHWPPPAEGAGEWVEASTTACASGIHACLPEQLPLWLQDELWEIELDGGIERLERKVVAERGRLVRRIEAWDAGALAAYARACLERLTALASAHDAATGYARDGEELLSGEPLFVAFAAARAAELVAGPEAYDAERAWQARWLAERLSLAL
jgi:hypothetical protein